MSTPSNFHEFPNPTGEAAGVNSRDAGSQSPSKIAQKYRPKGVPVSEPGVATLARFAGRLVDRETGRAYSADELAQRIADQTRVIPEILTIDGTLSNTDSSPITTPLQLTYAGQSGGKPMWSADGTSGATTNYVKWKADQKPYPIWETKLSTGYNASSTQDTELPIGLAWTNAIGSGSPLITSGAAVTNAAVAAAIAEDPAAVRLAAGVDERAPKDPLVSKLAANIATAGGTISSADLGVLSSALSTLRQSTAWPKIRELWVPSGDQLAGALVKLKYPTGGASSLTGTNLASGDYTRTTGITGNASNKRINSDFTPSTSGVTTGEQFFGIYALSSTWSGSLGGTSGSGTYLRYQTGASYLGEVNSTAAGAKHIGFGLRWAQFTGGNLETGQQGFRHTSVSATAANPTGTIQLLANSSTNYSNAAVGGYLYADAMTVAEIGAVAKFFDDVNSGFGRTVNKSALNVLGDSIANGYGVTSTQRFSYLLAAELGITEANEGTDGEAMSSTATGAPSFFYGDPDSAAYKINQKGSTVRATVTVWEHGINDILNGVTTSQFESDYEAALLAFRDRGGYSLADDLVICTPPWVNLNDGDSGGDYTAARHRTFADIVLKLAAKYNIRCADLYRGRLAGQSAAFQGDNIHPNADGHAYIADDIADAINF